MSLYTLNTVTFHETKNPVILNLTYYPLFISFLFALISDQFFTVILKFLRNWQKEKWCCSIIKGQVDSVAQPSKQLLKCNISDYFKMNVKAI